MVFSKDFKSLTGYEKFRWQERLYALLVEEKQQWPGALDLPTGLGKTSVMAIWMMARAVNRQIPRRLIYIVDRRTVVDQATREAEKLHRALEKEELREIRNRLGLADGCLPISTLRGSHIDNREWLADPTLPAIVVGTIDMIGSRLLFEGYGVSRGMRPYHAGLLGTDALFVLDEAHLCPPFEALLGTVQKLRCRQANISQQGIPSFHILTLSATGRKSKGSNVFSLQDEDYGDAVVSQRLRSSKSLTVHVQEPEEKLIEMLSRTAWEKKGNNNRVLIYCDKRKDAQEVKKKLAGLAKKEKPDIQVEMMVGARRVFERDRLASWLEQSGLVSGADVMRDAPVFLVATSAGEVGVDIDADHMVCDLVAFERMVQRFGRVNRLGMGQSSIDVLAVILAKEKPEEPVPPANFGMIVPVKPTKLERGASEKVRTEHQERNKRYKEELKDYRATNKKHDKAMESYHKELEKFWKESREHVVFEARLSLLEALQGDASPAALVDLKRCSQQDQKLAQWMEQASTPLPLRPALTLPLVEAWSMTSLREHTGRPAVGPWLRGWVEEEPQAVIVWRWHLPWHDGNEEPDAGVIEAFFEAAPLHLLELLETGASEIADRLCKRAQAVLKRGEHEAMQPAMILLDPAGEFRGAWRLGELADKEKKKTLMNEVAGNRCVAAGWLGGLDSSGLLDAKADEVPGMLDLGWEVSVLERIGYQVASKEEDVDDAWRIVHRYARRITDGDEDTETSGLVVRALRQVGSGRVGDPAVARREQTLEEHLAWAGEAAREIGERLELPDEFVHMLTAAARVHDLGKAREQWQNAMNAPMDGRPYAKTKGGGNSRLLSGYRHEFGSLVNALGNHELAALPEPLWELALHLIASHHGHARPVIPAIDPATPPSLLAEQASQVALRFARLQRKWGPWGLAWWEAVFRAADWRASARLDEIEPEGGN